MEGLAMRRREEVQGCGVERNNAAKSLRSSGRAANGAERSSLALPQPPSETIPPCSTPPLTTAYSETPLVIT